MSTDALSKLRALARTRPELAQRVASAIGDVSAAFMGAETASATSAASLAAYDPAGDDGERRAMQDALSAVVPVHEALSDALAELARVAGELRQGDERIARAARDVHDPALVAAASPQAALALLKPELAEAWATGDVEFRDARAFVNAVDEHASACAQLRCQGGAGAEPARAVIFLPLLEALARLDRVPLGRPWEAAGYPKLTANAVVEWVRAASEREPHPGQGANARALFLRVRAAIEAGCGTMYAFEAWDGERAGNVARVAEAPPGAPRRLQSVDPGHYPSGVAPTPEPLRRRSAVTHVAAAAEPSASPLGRPAIPRFASRVAQLLEAALGAASNDLE